MKELRQLLGLEKQYNHSPIDFCSFFFPKLTLRTWQKELLLEYEKALKETPLKVFRKAVSGGRGIGKTTLIALLVLWQFLTRPNVTCIIVSNSETQSRSVIWKEVLKWLGGLPLASSLTIGTKFIRPSKEALNYGLNNGKSLENWEIRIQLWSDNESGFVGVHNQRGVMLIFDEASGVPLNVWEASEGFFTDKVPFRSWFSFSNPRENQGGFFNCFSPSSHWSTSQISSFSVAELDTEHLENMALSFGGMDNPRTKIELLGEFSPASEESFITYSEASLLRAGSRASPFYSKESDTLRVMGIDLAGRGLDQSYLLIREGYTVLFGRSLPKKSTTALDLIEQLAAHWRIDLLVFDLAFGVAFVDFLLERLDIRIQGVNFGEKADDPTLYRNKRAEMWDRVKAWLEKGHCSPDFDTENLITQLMTVRVAVGNDSRLLLESKQTMRLRGVASPDMADALALTFAEECNPVQILDY